jgi:hypothetical protein
MKHTWKNPTIEFNQEPGDDIVIGGGSGQSTTDPYPCSYKDWLTLFADDYDLDDDVDFDDYRTWWEENEFSEEEWDEYNS